MCFLGWRFAKKKKANLKYIPLDSTGRITVEAFQKTLSSKTKVVALTYDIKCNGLYYTD